MRMGILGFLLGIILVSSSFYAGYTYRGYRDSSKSLEKSVKARDKSEKDIKRSGDKYDQIIKNAVKVKDAPPAPALHYHIEQLQRAYDGS